MKMLLVSGGFGVDWAFFERNIDLVAERSQPGARNPGVDNAGNIRRGFRVPDEQ